MHHKLCQILGGKLADVLSHCKIYLHLWINFTGVKDGKRKKTQQKQFSPAQQS